MTDRHWAEVWKVYCEIRNASEGQRSTTLLSLPNGIREEVQELLEQSEAVSQFSQIEPAKPAPQYRFGDEIGRYVITGLIGEGGFGCVYSAHDKDLRRSVAIKVLSSQGGELGKGLVEEARLASALNHPNILTIHETIEIAGQQAMVMEFVAGQSLRRELAERKGPLPLESAIGYGRQIAQALGAAHAVKIVHRDVKPENILIRPDGYLKLVDFGLASARLPEDVHSWQPFHGTLRYTSPEQLKGAASSPASDIFALGLVLYEMVTGVHPFWKGTPIETAGAIASQAPLPPSRYVAAIPIALNQLIPTMLEKDPARRPPAAAVLEILGNVSSRPAGKTRQWMPAAAALVAAAAGAAAWLWWRTPPPVAIQLTTVPLTGNSGREREPAISSDGRFVVCEWQPNIGAPFKTLVREIGSEAIQELPIEPPFAWVPGTDRIGFKRSSGTSHSLYTISRQGGPSERVFSTNRDFSLMQWSPDRRFIVYLSGPGTDQRGALFLYTVATGEHQRLVLPDADQYLEGVFAISPDGKHLAFRRHTQGLSSDVYLTDFPQPGNLRRLSFLDTPGGETIAWLRDGSGLVSSSFQGADYSLWLHPVIRPGPATRLTSLGVQVWGLNAALSINRLAWQNAYDDANIWRVPAAGGQAERVIASPLRDADVAVSATGMLAFRSDRSGFPELWLAGPGGSSQRRMTTIGGLAGSPRWTTDGRRLAFDARHKGKQGDIFVVDCEPAAIRCGSPQQLTDDPEADALPNWSRDGKFVYFTSRRSGAWQVWRVPASGLDRTAVQITAGGGFYAAESDDGQWLYYSRTDTEPPALWRKRLGGKLPFDSPGEMVLTMDPWSVDTWEFRGNEIFYQLISARLPGSIEAFDLRTRRTRQVFEAGSAPITRGLSVSPDGKWVYFARTDHSESNVVYADYEVLK